MARRTDVPADRLQEDLPADDQSRRRVESTHRCWIFRNGSSRMETCHGVLGPESGYRHDFRAHCREGAWHSADSEMTELGFRCDNVSHVFSNRGSDIMALKDVTFSAQPGEFICLVGPSGCGKVHAAENSRRIARTDVGQSDIRKRRYGEANDRTRFSGTWRLSMDDSARERSLRTRDAGRFSRRA